MLACDAVDFCNEAEACLTVLNEIGENNRLKNAVIVIEKLMHDTNVDDHRAKSRKQRSHFSNTVFLVSRSGLNKIKPLHGSL